MKITFKDILKVTLPGLIVFLALNVTKPKAATFEPSVPSVKTFNFINPANVRFYVTSWFEDGIKCTALTSREPGSNSNGIPVSISCVKL